MKIETIFCDLDGVLADFHSAALLAHGREVLSTKAWPKGVDLKDVLGLKYETAEDKTTFWKPINQLEFFWEELSSFPWVGQLLEELESRVGNKNVIICTSASEDPKSNSGKAQWLLDRGIRKGLIQINRTEKNHLSGPGKLLIDDWSINMGPWVEKGGDVILFPQPWNVNHAHAEDPMTYVINELNLLITE